MYCQNLEIFILDFQTRCLLSLDQKAKDQFKSVMQLAVAARYLVSIFCPALVFLQNLLSAVQ
jgi:hypothetical protein